MRFYNITTAILVSLLSSGCATELEKACKAGTGMNGMTPELTCQAALIDRQQQNAAIMTGIGVALVGAVTALAVVEATEPADQNYYYVAPQQPASVVIVH